MKKVYLASMTTFIFILLTACGVSGTGVSQEEYDDLKAQYEALQDEFDSLKRAYELTELELEALNPYIESPEDAMPTLSPTNDFFSDEQRRTQYEELYKSYQYTALENLVNMYISGHDIEETDSAYAILELLAPAMGYEEQWIVTLDEFDGKHSLTFAGANSISDSNSVKVTLKDNWLDIKVGFRKTGWLFFDDVALSIDGEKVYNKSVKSYDATTTVISGNTIEECCQCDFYDKTFEQFADAETMMLRFSNTKSGETYDHVLTQNEIDALYCGWLLQNSNRELGNLLYRFNNPK